MTTHRRALTIVSSLDQCLIGMEKTSQETARFLYEVDGATGCWIWQGYADRNGYGRIYNRSRRRIEWAHRFSYELAKGAIEPGHEIDHTCQTTLCVNPDHLDQVTRSEHIRRTMQRAGKDDRQLAAAHLRRSGLTYAEIAGALSYSTKTGAAAAVKSAIAKGLVDPDDVPRVVRLTEDEYDDIRLMHDLGIPQTVIGRFYRIDSSQVSRICNGKRGANRRRDAV